VHGKTDTGYRQTTSGLADSADYISCEKPHGVVGFIFMKIDR
jgi:hypothetical protein